MKHIMGAKSKSKLTNVEKGDIQPNAVLKIPIAHGEGRYYADEATMKQIMDNGQVGKQPQ